MEGTVGQVAGSLKSYFSLDNLIASGLAADAYQGLELSRSVHVAVWVIREKIGQDSPAARSLFQRMALLESLEPPLVDIVGYGVDREGIGFVVMNLFDGYSVAEGNLDSAEAERRFMSCIGFVARMHGAGLVCGDIFPGSFWINRTGEVCFNGIVGTFDGLGSYVRGSIPVEVAAYVSPEQIDGAQASFSSDIFSLGVLGYYLLTRQFPYKSQLRSGTISPIEQVVPISDVVLNPPVWADEILITCLDPDPEKRYQTAGQLIEAIVAVRQRTADQHNLPMKTGSQRMRDQGNSEYLGTEMSDRSFETKPPRKFRDWRIYLAIVSGGIIAVLLVGFFLRPRQASEDRLLKSGLQLHKMITGKDLSTAIEGLSRDDLTLPEKDTYLELIAASDDPLAHDVLLTTARDARVPELRFSAERALIERARRLGMIRSSEEVKSWLQLQKERPTLPVYYEPALKSLDTTLPIEARNASLRQAYAANPQFILRLAAALALDAKNISDYQPILAQLVGDASKLENAQSRHPLALIVADADLAAAFGDDVIYRREELPDSDVLWVMENLATRHDTRVRALANLAIQRKLTNPMRSTFLEMIRDRADIPLDVMQGLVRAATGNLTRDDISNFGKWYDVAVEDILFSVCADSDNGDILVEAFDTLGSRSLAHEPGSSLVEWVRASQWNNRKEFVHAIGVLSNQTIAVEADIKDALKVFDGYERDQRLLGILMRAENPIVTRIVVEKYGTKLGIGRLLNLLRADDTQVKLTAINALKTFNDVGALRIIIDNYEREKDPVVKAAYEESFWFIQERIKNQQ